MNKAICFGAAGSALRLYEKIKKNYDVICFTDNDANKWGKKIYDITILPPEQCMTMRYDVIIITSLPGLDSIYIQLQEMGVPTNQIITTYIADPLESRRIFLEQLSCMQASMNLNIEVAEAGVFEGDFAKWINKYYPQRKLHLFDTFEGFDDRDIIREGKRSRAKTGDYSNTTAELVINKMQYPQNVVMHIGYFPDTAREIESSFCFVNLDLDLYEPTYQGLKFFADKMVSGGIILVHDYFSDNFKGPQEAVDKFIRESDGKYAIYPIGDGISVMITGF